MTKLKSEIEMYNDVHLKRKNSNDASRYLTTLLNNIIKSDLIEREHFKLLNKLLYCKFDSVTHRRKDTVEKPLRTRAQTNFSR